MNKMQEDVQTLHKHTVHRECECYGFHDTHSHHSVAGSAGVVPSITPCQVGDGERGIDNGEPITICHCRGRDDFYPAP